jgi:hypothetical protein
LQFADLAPQQLKERTGVERLLVLFLSKCSGQAKRALQVGGLPESPPVSGGASPCSGGLQVGGLPESPPVSGGASPCSGGRKGIHDYYYCYGCVL